MFSIIIPTYNRRQQIKACIDSVLAQTFHDYEIIVVDDGSTDGTAEAIRSYDDRIRFIQQANRGPAAARNTGIRQATRDYVAFLDSDDLWFPDTLLNYAEAIRRFERPAVIVGESVEYADCPPMRKAGSRQTVALLYKNGLDFLARAGVTVFYTGRLVVRKDALEAAGGFVARRMNSEDNDLMLKLCTAEGLVHLKDPPAYALFRGRNNAVSEKLELSYAGMQHLIQSENAGCYPGGTSGAAARWGLILFMVRAISVRLVRAGVTKEAMTLYRATFKRHLSQARFKYLLGFPMMFALHYLKQRVAHKRALKTDP